jgi:hypothetical protein
MIQHLKRNIENVTYEVLIFEYTPDTGNNSSFIMK